MQKSILIVLIKYNELPATERYFVKFVTQNIFEESCHLLGNSNTTEFIRCKYKNKIIVTKLYENILWNRRI